jgi:hypothetical protein
MAPGDRADGAVDPSIGHLVPTVPPVAASSYLEGGEEVLAGGVPPAVAGDDHGLDALQGGEGGLSDATGHRQGLLHEPICWHYSAHQADAQRLLSVDVPPRKA